MEWLGKTLIECREIHLGIAHFVCVPYCDKITVLYGCGFGFKKLGLADPPAPSVGTKSQIFPKIRFEGFPKQAMKQSSYEIL